MVSRFDEDEPGLSLRSKLYQVAQKRGINRKFLRNRYDEGIFEGISFFGKSMGIIICSSVLSLAVLDKEPDSIGRAIDLSNTFEANVSWVGGDSKARIVEDMMDDGQLFRLGG